MNYGPLEFADYLRRASKRGDSPTVRAAREANPAARPANLLTVLSGPRTVPPSVGEGLAAAVDVYEAVAMSPPSEPRGGDAIRVMVRCTARPVVLVLSSHQPVEWHVAQAPGATLTALLLSGFGRSMVMGAGEAAVHRIGGFYAFKRGSAEYRHLESEVMRCTGRMIETFQSVFAGNDFEIGD